MTVTTHEPTTTSTLDEETRRVLVTAKGILANGWCQGSLGDYVVGFCAVGAIQEAAGWRAFSEKVIRRLEERLDVGELIVSDFLRPLAAWNDMPGRTVDDVVGLIDLALQQ